MCISPNPRQVTASGLTAIGDIAWGSHICQFYRDRDDLIETLVPFFRAGLLGNESCLWITSEPLTSPEAEQALLYASPELEPYVRSGQISILDHGGWYDSSDPQLALQAWLAREEEARQRGFAGLRVSGNTSWLGREHYEAFAEYEAAVHKAFADRRILALCSYHIDHCRLEDVVEVLRNHKLALVRRSGVWQVAESATVIMDSFESGSSAAHAVQFYGGELPAGRISDFLRRALDRADGAAAIIARPENALAIERALAAAGVDITAERLSGRLQSLDAFALLDTFFDGPDPDRARFTRALAPVLALADRFASTHLYSEMLEILAERGQLPTALLVERWCNDLLDEHPLSLLCGYGAVSSTSDAQGHYRVAALHDATAGDRSSLLLASERRARARAQSAATHLAQLQRVTSALSEALTSAEVGGVVVRDMAAATGAAEAVLGTPGADGSLGLVAYQGADAADRERSERIPVDASSPLAAAFRSGQPLWLGSAEAIGREHSVRRTRTQALACLPLIVCGEKLGAICFQFAEPRRFEEPERALFEDLARQTALALERARLYESARREQARAVAANRAKDEFLAMLGHELRNPLSPILTALQLMRLRAGDVCAKERAIIERQVRHMSRLVDDLLDVSRITRGKVQLERRRVELAEVVAGAIETASPLLEERSHRLVTEVPTHGMTVYADSQRLTQAVGNLLTNAAKYTAPGGSIVVRAERVGERAILRVRDSGIGIHSEMLAEIFDLFVQGPRTSARSEGGLGLGLAIVRAVVELHGGAVRAESDGPGRGSEFVVELPALAAETTSRADEKALLQRPTGSLRILVVDDNTDAAEALAELLRDSGHVTSVAHDGPNALSLAAEFRPEVALLDIGLPVMDGYELGARLREQTPQMPPVLVAVTGYGLASDHERSASAGFAAHLVKPLDLASLEAVLGQVAPGLVVTAEAASN